MSLKTHKEIIVILREIIDLGYHITRIAHNTENLSDTYKKMSVPRKRREELMVIVEEHKHYHLMMDGWTPVTRELPETSEVCDVIQQDNYESRAFYNKASGSWVSFDARFHGSLETGISTCDVEYWKLRNEIPFVDVNSVNVAKIAEQFLRICRTNNRETTFDELEYFMIISYGIHMAKFNEPLFYNNIYAMGWEGRYIELDNFSDDCKKINLEHVKKSCDVSCEVWTSIQHVYDKYGEFNVVELGDLLTGNNTPFAETYEDCYDRVISDKEFNEYYSQVLFS